MRVIKKTYIEDLCSLRSFSSKRCTQTHACIEWYQPYTSKKAPHRIATFCTSVELYINISLLKQKSVLFSDHTTLRMYAMGINAEATVETRNGGHAA